MALPKKKIRVSTTQNLIGSDRVKELLNQTDEKTTFLPRTISLKDIDSSTFSFIKDGDLKLTLEGYNHLKGKQVPVVFLTNERWGEFSKTWVYTDDDKNLPTPYVTIRRITTEKGSQSGDRYNVPQLRRFNYLDVPSLDKDVLVMTRYKIPQPVTIDLTYEIRFFTKYMRDLNIFIEKFHKTFASMQAYILVNGHYMPIFLESDSDDDTMEDINGDRFYVKIFEIKVRGYIQNQEDFEITKTVRKRIININFIEDEIQRIERIQEGGFVPPPVVETFPFYYGSVPASIAQNMNTFNANLFLFKLDEPIGDKTLFFNATNERIVYMYDKSYGDLSEIIDIAGDDILPAFTLKQYTVTLEFDNGVTRDYYVLYNNLNVTVSNYKLIFKF